MLGLALRVSSLITVFAVQSMLLAFAGFGRGRLSSLGLNTPVGELNVA